MKFCKLFLSHKHVSIRDHLNFLSSCHALLRFPGWVWCFKITSGGRLIHSWELTGFWVAFLQRGADKGKQIPFEIPRLPAPIRLSAVYLWVPASGSCTASGLCPEYFRPKHNFIYFQKHLKLTKPLRSELKPGIPWTKEVSNLFWKKIEKSVMSNSLIKQIIIINVISQ